MVNDQEPQQASERTAIVLPASDRNEAILDSVAAVTALVPLLGGPVSNILSGDSSDRRFERMKAVVLELARKLDEVGAARDAYVKSEDFEDLLIEGLERATRERSSEKRELYANILSISVLRPDLDYNEKLAFLRTLEALKAREIEVLRGFLETGKPKSGSFAGSARGVLLERLSDIAPADVDQSLDTLERAGVLTGINAIGAITASAAQAKLRGFLTSYGGVFVGLVVGARRAWRMMVGPAGLGLHAQAVAPTTFKSRAASSDCLSDSTAPVRPPPGQSAAPQATYRRHEAKVGR